MDNEIQPAKAEDMKVNTEKMDIDESAPQQPRAAPQIDLMETEETPPAIPTKQLREEFNKFCEDINLNLTEEVRDKAWRLLQPLRISVQDDDRMWLFAAAVHLAGLRPPPPTEGHDTLRSSDISLTQLLTDAPATTKHTVLEFFEPLKKLASLLPPSAERAAYSEHIRLLQRKVVVVGILYKKFEKVLNECILSSLSGDTATAVATFGWQLFLVAKERLAAGDPPDLLRSFHLLVACTAVALRPVPLNQRVRQQWLEFAETHPVDGHDALVSFLCFKNAARPADVFREDAALHQLLRMLCDPSVQPDRRLRSKESPSPANVSTWRFDTEQGELMHNNRVLSRLYEETSLLKGHFDERQFLGNSEKIGIPTTPLSPAATAVSTGDIARTPMTKALHSVAWLQSTLERCPDTPSENILQFVRRCSRDPRPLMDAVVARAASSAVDTALGGAARRVFAVKLYYRLLEAMLFGEEERLRQHDFTALLNNETFHASLLACCVELVRTAFRVAALPFPAVLPLFGLEPFDFFRIIESIVRHEQGMPQDLVRHLSRIEEAILEQLAWSSSSRLYALLGDPDRQKAVLDAVLAPIWKAPAPRTPAVTATSPAAAATPSPQPPPTPSRTAVHSLELFFRKVRHLCDTRVREVCHRLRIPEGMFQQISYNLIHVLIKRPEIMRNRHLDHVAVSMVFAVCRLNQIDKMKFNDILKEFPKKEGWSLFREVQIAPTESSTTATSTLSAPLSPSTSKTNVIEFYNTVFVPQLEGLLNELKPPQGLAGPSAAAPTAAYPPSPPSLKLGQNMTVTVSPRRGGPVTRAQTAARNTTPSRTSTAMASSSASPSPRASVRYNFGASPSRDLQQINRSINSPDHRISTAVASPSATAPPPPTAPTSPLASRSPAAPTRRPKRLTFDHAEDDAAANGNGKPPRKRAKTTVHSLADLASVAMQEAMNGENQPTIAPIVDDPMR